MCINTFSCFRPTNVTSLPSSLPAISVLAETTMPLYIEIVTVDRRENSILDSSYPIPTPCTVPYCTVLHLLGNCPNITCFRCGDFGHHSRTCSNARRYSRPAICSECGSRTHDNRQCPFQSGECKRKLEGETRWGK